MVLIFPLVDGKSLKCDFAKKGPPCFLVSFVVFGLVSFFPVTCWGEERESFSRLFQNPSFWEISKVISTDTTLLSRILGISNTHFVGLSSTQNHSCLHGLNQMQLFVHVEAIERAKKEALALSLEKKISELAQSCLASAGIKIISTASGSDPLLLISVQMLLEEPSVVLFWTLCVEKSSSKYGIDQTIWHTCGFETGSPQDLEKIHSNSMARDLLRRFLEAWKWQNK